MTGSSGSDSNDPDVIASDIEQTRADMTATIDAIQERLTPERVAGQAKDAAADVAEQAKETATVVVEQARESATEVVEQARETATEVVEQARETAVEVTQQARDAALEVVDHAVEEAKAAVRELGGQARAAMRDATIGKVERVASKTGETAGGLRQTIMTSIQQNPIPAALVGAGLGWMFLNRPSTSSTSTSMSTRYQPGPYQPGQGSRPASYYSSQTGSGAYSGGGADQTAGQMGEMAGQVGQTAGDMAGQVGQTAGQMVGQVGQTAGQVVDQVQETASQARGRLDQMLHESPMQVGALSLLIGGALALTMPPTSREQELMGPMRDQLVEKVQVTAQDTLNKVEKVAEEVQHTAEREAKAEGLTPS